MKFVQLYEIKCGEDDCLAHYCQTTDDEPGRCGMCGSTFIAVRIPRLTEEEWEQGMGCPFHRARRSGSCHDCAILMPLPGGGL